MPIHQRQGVRVTISEKFVEIFNWYEGDLDETRQTYEKYKVTLLYNILDEMITYYTIIYIYIYIYNLSNENGKMS